MTTYRKPLLVRWCAHPHRCAYRAMQL